MITLTMIASICDWKSAREKLSGIALTVTLDALCILTVI